MDKYKFKRGFNIRRFVIILFALLIVCYGLFNARNLLMGPIIEVWSPAAEAKTNESIITIKGRARNIAAISLNERPIFVDPDGIFQEKLLLAPGFNVIEIKARDRFKKEAVETVRIYCSSTIPTINDYNKDSEEQE